MALAALRRFFALLVTRHAILLNPFDSVRGPNREDRREGRAALITPALGRAGHVSVATARSLPLDPHSSDTVRGTHVPLETTAEILAKKLRFRMARDKELLPRDLYDIAVARQPDPASLQIAMDALRTDQLAELDQVFKDHPGRACPQEDPSPLLAPSDPVLAERCPAIVERLVRDALRQRTHDRGPGLDFTR